MQAILDAIAPAEATMNATPAGIRIEAAAPADVPIIHMLIRELAAFERLLDEAKATEAQLHDGLFGARPSAEVVIARVGAEVAGFALFFHNFSTFVGKPGLYLEDLYVRQQFRGQGCGEALLRYLARLAVERGCGRFEWSVLDWNQRAIDFYKSLGAQPMAEWTVFRISGESLTRLGAGS
jgi:GNAT superfamily N-acetyltransferase